MDVFIVQAIVTLSFDRKNPDDYADLHYKAIHSPSYQSKKTIISLLFGRAYDES